MFSVDILHGNLSITSNILSSFDNKFVVSLFSETLIIVIISSKPRDVAVVIIKSRQVFSSTPQRHLLPCFSKGQTDTFFCLR